MDILPIHPGEILFEEFMQPYELSQNALAKALKVPPRRINEIVHCKRGISVDTALRLSKFFGTTPEFWLNLQLKYDLETEKDKKLDIINSEVEKFVA
jgi:addiction module HigA family antidote